MRNARAIVIFAVALGCAPSSGGLLVTDDPTPTEQTPDPDGEVVHEQAPGADPAPPGASFFHRDRYLEVEIELPEASWSSLLAAPYEYTPAHVTLDGRRVEDIGIRIRGRIGSFREVWQKPKWRLDFNRYVPGRRVDGLEALNLDNNVVDCSSMKQQLAFHVFALTDTLGSRGGFARVSVNGVPYGIYDVLEVQDDRFLADRFEDGTGTLYDGAYIWYGDRNYTLMDFKEGIDVQYELEEGEFNGNVDLVGVTEALVDARAGDDFVGTMSEVWDMERMYRYAAVEHWIGQNDGYFLNTNNNRVYFDPADGRGTFISYDLDYSFMANAWGNRSFDNPRGELAKGCVADAECRQGIADAMAEVLDILEAADLEESFNAWDVFSRPGVRDDPKSGCSADQISNARDRLRAWIRDRDAQMRTFWGIP